MIYSPFERVIRCLTPAYKPNIACTIRNPLLIGEGSQTNRRLVNIIAHARDGGALLTTIRHEVRLLSESLREVMLGTRTP